MKAEAVINQLALRLPQYTDKFTTNISVVSLTRSGTTVTVETAAVHGLTVGKQVNIQGAKTPLTIASLTRSGTVGTLVLDNNHDMTEGENTSVELSGAVEAEFNGTFTLLSVQNRKTITFTMADAGPVTATGTPLLLNGASILQQYNGLWAVATVPDTTHFTYEITDTTLYTPAAGTISARLEPRISGAISEERLIAAYTAQPTGNYWAFVVLGDVIASKSRHIESDAVDNLQRGHEYRQQIVQPFTVFVFIPTSAEVSARDARDAAEDLFRPICRALIQKKFDSGLNVGAQNPVVFTDHGFVAYNAAFYVHSYAFQATADITFEDTIGYDDDVAFRDISLTMGVDVGTEVMTADIDLDDVLL